jgi:hypothetical protein
VEFDEAAQEGAGEDVELVELVHGGSLDAPIVISPNE